MGRTGRKRKSKVITSRLCCDEDLIKLQRSLKLKKLKVDVCEFVKTGRGMRCKSKIEPHDVLISIPLISLLSIDNLKHSKLAQLFSRPEYSDELILSILLLNEKHLSVHSHYYSYIKVLPESYSNIYFCTDSEAIKLPSWLKMYFDNQKKMVKELYDKATKTLGEEKCCHCNKLYMDVFNFHDFEWSWFTVNTRSVFLPLEHKTIALAPILDMFNHDNNADVKININKELNMYELTTLKSYKKYDEVFIKYGPHSNLKLLVEYGFILPTNPHDAVHFSFQDLLRAASKIHPIYGEITDLKYKFLKKNNLTVDLWKSKEEFSWNMKGCAFVLTAQNANFAYLQCKTYSQDFDTEEEKEVNQICELTADNKLYQLKNELSVMKSVEKSSEAFQICISLGFLQETFSDFWRMVWELRTSTIVMMAKLEERTRIKCNQYWPSRATETYGALYTGYRLLTSPIPFSLRRALRMRQNPGKYNISSQNLKYDVTP